MQNVRINLKDRRTRQRPLSDTKPSRRTRSKLSPFRSYSGAGPVIGHNWQVKIVCAVDMRLILPQGEDAGLLSGDRSLYQRHGGLLRQSKPLTAKAVSFLV